MTPIPPDTPLTATLTANEWNVVMAGIGEVPTKHGMPVLQKLVPQLEAASQAVEPTIAPPHRANGEDAHAPN